MVCFKLFARLMVTVKQPGKQFNKLSSLSWKLGGQVFISICKMGMASAATIAWDFDTSIGMVDQECFSKHKIVNIESWADSEPDFNAATKWGIHNVAASEIWSLWKFEKITCIVPNTSSFTEAVDHNCLSRAAAQWQFDKNPSKRPFLWVQTRKHNAIESRQATKKFGAIILLLGIQKDLMSNRISKY